MISLRLNRVHLSIPCLFSYDRVFLLSVLSAQHLISFHLASKLHMGENIEAEKKHEHELTRRKKTTPK